MTSISFNLKKTLAVVTLGVLTPGQFGGQRVDALKMNVGPIQEKGASAWEKFKKKISEVTHVVNNLNKLTDFVYDENIQHQLQSAQESLKNAQKHYGEQCRNAFSKEEEKEVIQAQILKLSEEINVHQVRVHMEELKQRNQNGRRSTWKIVHIQKGIANDYSYQILESILSALQDERTEFLKKQKKDRMIRKIVELNKKTHWERIGNDNLKIESLKHYKLSKLENIYEKMENNQKEALKNLKKFGIPTEIPYDEYLQSMNNEYFKAGDQKIVIS